MASESRMRLSFIAVSPAPVRAYQARCPAYRRSVSLCGQKKGPVFDGAMRDFYGVLSLFSLCRCLSTDLKRTPEFDAYYSPVLVRSRKKRNCPCKPSSVGIATVMIICLGPAFLRASVGRPDGIEAEIFIFPVLFGLSSRRDCRVSPLRRASARRRTRLCGSPAT